MKVIIAGSRTFNNYQLVEDTMSQIDNVTEVVCGGARGADELGRLWANKHGILITMFPAKWETYGKAAGFIRNHEMGDYADYLVAF